MWRWRYGCRRKVLRSTKRRKEGERDLRIGRSSSEIVYFCGVPWQDDIAKKRKYKCIYEHSIPLATIQNAALRKNQFHPRSISILKPAEMRRLAGWREMKALREWTSYVDYDVSEWKEWACDDENTDIEGEETSVIEAVETTWGAGDSSRTGMK